MIVPMKKVTLFFSAKHHDEALLRLRHLGVLHIQDIERRASDDIQQIETTLENIERILKLPELQQDASQLSEDNPEKTIEKILGLLQKRDSIQRELHEYQEIADWFERWGDISYSSVQALRESGIFIRLYLTDKGGLTRIPDDKQILVAGTSNNVVHLALISQSEDEHLDLRQDTIPQAEPDEVRSKINQLKKDNDEINGQLGSMAACRDMLTDYRIKLEKDLVVSRVKAGMGDVGDISYLQGFCPDEAVQSVRKMADSHGWGYLVEEPDDPSQVPTLTKNSKFVNMISPLFKFMSTLPGYDEMDVSMIFLAFFSVFFAIIIGDGGYGLIFMLLTIWMRVKFKKANSEFVNLMFLLSGTTLVWGLLTGTWFGSKTIAGLPFLRHFVIGKLDSFGAESESFVMLLSFIIGAIHLSVAHLMAAAKKRNITALGEIGWVCELWFIFFLAKKLVLGIDMPGYAMTLLWVGLAIILIFSNFQRNIFKGMLATLSNLPLSVIGSFSDIVSYIRLFAVGFAGFIVSSSFNTMAVGAGIDSVVSGIIAALIIFVGHALNIALCTMSVLVHGVRLNMLEFSGHVGVQWTGKPYEPFRE
jgi:V/A-type H+-transporting ATPase subunit I